MTFPYETVTIGLMPRRLRIASGGIAYHVLNRAAGRQDLFPKEGDYAAFIQVLEQTHKRLPIRILSYCLMSTHWHLVLWPEEDNELSEFLRLLTVTHTQRWHAHYHSAGTGPVYQGRFKSFPIQQDEHLLTVCRYVERNAVRAGLVERAERWEWCSPARRRRGAEPAPWLLELKQWPVDVPRDWRAWVNRAETAAELDALRKSVKRSSPYGEAAWQRRTAKRLGLESTLRPRGRPRVRSIKDSRPL